MGCPICGSQTLYGERPCNAHKCDKTRVANKMGFDLEDGKWVFKILWFSFIIKYKSWYVTYFNVKDQVSLKYKYNTVQIKIWKFHWKPVKNNQWEQSQPEHAIYSRHVLYFALTCTVHVGLKPLVKLTINCQKISSPNIQYWLKFFF